MGSLTVWNIMTLDGMFEGKEPWDLPFHSLVWGEELEQLSLRQLDELDYLLFGRRTYEGMAAHWRKETGAIADRMNSARKLVASRTLTTVDWNNSALLKGEATEAVREVRQEAGSSIYVFGSADLVATLLAAGLVDEYRVCIAPVLLGGGAPLFRPAGTQIGLELLEATALRNGGVLLRYRPENS